MKKTIIFIVVLILNIIPLYADVDIAKNNAQFIAAGLEKKGYEFREFDEEYSGNLVSGESGYITLNLFKGLEYAIVVGGATEAKQISVSIFDEMWKEIARSPEKSSVAVELIPKTTGVVYVKIEMLNSAATQGADWVQLIGYKKEKKK